MEDIFKLEKQGITKRGHTMFPEDIVSELNEWRKYAKKLEEKLSLLMINLHKKKTNE
jgi:hypothetical protein